MSRRRYISTTISVDKMVNQLAMTAGDFAAMLYTWMIPHAGDDGCLTGDPDEILMTVIPGRRDKTPADVVIALAAMAELGLIGYLDGRIAFPAESFYRYQTYIKAENRRPQAKAENSEPQQETPKNAELPIIGRVTPQNADERRKTPENAVSVTPSVPPSFPVSPSPSVPVRENVGAVAPRAVPKPKQRERERNPTWDALATACGAPMTDNEESDFAKTVAQLRKVTATPEQIADFREWWFVEHGRDITITHRCYRDHWGRFMNAPPKPPPSITELSPGAQAAVTVNLAPVYAAHERRERERNSIPGQNDRPASLPAGARRNGAGVEPTVHNVSRRLASGED